jgi:outer membrane immunogenic protein
LRARAGFAINNTLFYATAGLAYGGVRIELAGVRESKNHLGWAAGAGMEVGLTRNWSARAEYLVMDLADRGYVMTGSNNGFEGNLVRLGVNYRF